MIGIEPKYTGYIYYYIKIWKQIYLWQINPVKKVLKKRTWPLNLKFLTLGDPLNKAYCLLTRGIIFLIGHRPPAQFRLKCIYKSGVWELSQFTWKPRSWLDYRHNLSFILESISETVHLEQDEVFSTNISTLKYLIYNFTKLWVFHINSSKDIIIDEGQRTDNKNKKTINYEKRIF